MLVLTRGINETIVIGEGIEIMVIGVKGRKVKLGVRAPIDVTVHRKEVYLNIQGENIDAARNNTVDAKSIDFVNRLLARRAASGSDSSGSERLF